MLDRVALRTQGFYDEVVENTWDIRLWPDVEAQILALADE